MTSFSDKQKECQECGWRGMTTELEQSDVSSGGQIRMFCPECGGVHIEDAGSEKSDS